MLSFKLNLKLSPSIFEKVMLLIFICKKSPKKNSSKCQCPLRYLRNQSRELYYYYKSLVLLQKLNINIIHFMFFRTCNDLQQDQSIHKLFMMICPRLVFDTYKSDLMISISTEGIFSLRIHGYWLISSFHLSLKCWKLLYCRDQWLISIFC